MFAVNVVDIPAFVVWIIVLDQFLNYLPVIFCFRLFILVVNELDRHFDHFGYCSGGGMPLA